MRWKDFSDAALFGLIDGLNGAVGLIIGLLHVHAGAALIFVAILSRAGASCVSMAGAQFESSDASARKVRYTAKAQVGGKLAQIGSRLVDATARKMSDEFFKSFVGAVTGNGGAQG
jgi:carbon monoxide dehydrogenase subunit G